MENASAVIFDGGGVFDQQRLNCLSEHASRQCVQVTVSAGHAIIWCALPIDVAEMNVAGAGIDF
jgi:hypothetical protein